MSALRLAWAQIRPQLLQLATAVIVVALSVALAASMLLANNALRESFEASIDALAGRADLQITTASGGSFDESFVDEARAVEGVLGAAPLLMSNAFVKRGERASIRVVGVDMLDDVTVRLYQVGPEVAGLDDPLLFLSQPDSVIVPRSFTRAYSVGQGDIFELQSPSGSRQVTVRGILEDSGVGRAFDGRLVVMDLESAQDLLGETGRLSQIDVVVKPGVPVAEVAERLRSTLPIHLEVEPVADRKASLRDNLVGFEMMLDAIAALALVLAALITSNRLATIYEARTWEMGVMRALGTSPMALLRDLLAEASIVALVGVLLGLPLGILFAQLIVSPVADTMSLNFSQIVEAPWVPPRPTPLIIASLAGLASGVLAGFVPAWRSTRVSVAVVLSKGRSRLPRQDGWYRKAARRVLPALALLMLGIQFATGDGRFGALTMVLIACAGGLLVQPGLRLLNGPVRRLLGSAASIGVEDQSLVPSRAVGAGGVLLAGIALVVWIGSTGRSFERFVVESLMSTRQGDLIIHSASSASAVGAGETRLPERVLDELAAIPGVETVGAIVYDVSVRSSIGVLAVDPVRLQRAEFGKWRLEDGAAADALARVAGGDGFLPNSQFVTNRGVAVGDVVGIMTPSGLLERPLLGVVNSSFLSQRGDLVMSRDLYRERWGQSTFTEAEVILASGFSAPEIHGQIVSRLGDRYGVRVRTQEELSGWFADSVRQGFAFTDVMVMVALFVVLLGSGDALAANVLERMREIGTLRALGLSQRDVAGMILAQALAIGVVGSVLGVLVGLGMSLSFVEGLLRTVLGWELELYPTHAVALESALLGVLACLVGAALPALRAARLSTVAALRYE